MTVTRREAILEGTQAAQRLHAQLGTQKAFEREGGSRVDVFGTATQLGAFILFRPLNGLLGAYLSPPIAPLPGIIISTQRDLHVQRFTAAHELGHFYLGHKPTVDDQVGLWRGESRDMQEVAADAFASEFMLPRWLYVHHAKRHDWQKRALQRAETVYQLALRLGASYDATCWGLTSHGILDRRSMAALREREPKELKMAALAGRTTLTNPWADVWVIDEHDDGLAFEGGPDDVVIFRFRERASSGYLWDEGRLQEQGFELLADEREEGNSEEYGSEGTRILVTRVREPKEYRVSFSERRPWRPQESLAEVSLRFDFQGKEEGLSRTARKTMAAA